MPCSSPRTRDTPQGCACPGGRPPGTPRVGLSVSVLGAPVMIVASDIELRAGARLLLESASFQVSAGDRIGLVGRNGAGKTTLAKVLAGQAQQAAGSVRRSGSVGYLPQDPRTGDLDMLAIDRVLSARGLDQLRAELRAAEAQMADPDSAAAADAIRRYGRLEERLA